MLRAEGVLNNALGERDRLRGAYLSFGGVACCVSLLNDLPSCGAQESISPAALISRLM